jgi:hypothetical protein
MRIWTPLLLLLLLAPTPAAAQAGPAAPEIGVLIERIALALGGVKGGSRVLETADGLDFVFDRTVRDSTTRADWTATHGYFVLDGGRRRRLDIRVATAKGVDSAAVVDGDRAWLIVDGEVSDLEPAAADARMGEYTPARLFSVPLALAAEGRQILGDAALQVAARVDEGGKARFILVGGEGDDSVRLEVDARTYLPLEVAFKSPSGDVAYRYGRYKEVAKGLVIPFEREFHRNGILVSRTTVKRLRLEGPKDPQLFERSQVALGALDRPGDAAP